jgi:hypothetical protein
MGIHRGGGSRKWAVSIPKLLAIARSLDKTFTYICFLNLI